MKMHKTRHKRILVVVLGLAAGIQTPRAQVPSAVPLAEVQRLKCAFTLLATESSDATHSVDALLKSMVRALFFHL